MIIVIIMSSLFTWQSERAQIRTQIHALSLENRQYRTVMDGKKKEMEPLQQALGKLRGPSGIRERSSGICSSEEELNDLVSFFSKIYFYHTLINLLSKFYSTSKLIVLHHK